MVKPKAYVRPPDEDLMLLPRGTYGFLNVLVTVNGDMAPPDAFDYSGAIRIEDPDGNDITSTWVTTELDSSDANDTFDSDHSDYVGDDAGSEVNKGLFARSKSVSTPGGDGWVGLKVKVPDGAEETNTNPNRFYKIVWDIRLNGVRISDGDGEFFERFNIGPPGILDFGSGTVTADDIKALYKVKDMTDDEIKGFISAATDVIDGFLAMVGCTRPDVLPPSLRSAIRFMAVWLLLEFDQSRGLLTDSVSQGGMSLSFQAVDQRKNIYFNPEKNTGLAVQMLMAFLATKSIYALKIPVAHVFRKVTPMDFVARHIPWFWRDY